MEINIEKLKSIKGRKVNEVIETYDNIRFDDFDNGGLNSSCVKGQFPTGCADPYIMRFNGMYYLYVTTSGLDSYGLRAWKSRNLLDWEPCQGKGLPLGYVVSDKDDNGRYTQNAVAIGSWSPTIQKGLLRHIPSRSTAESMARSSSTTMKESISLMRRLLESPSTRSTIR